MAQVAYSKTKPIGRTTKFTATKIVRGEKYTLVSTKQCNILAETSRLEISVGPGNGNGEAEFFEEVSWIETPPKPRFFGINLVVYLVNAFRGLKRFKEVKNYRLIAKSTPQLHELMRKGATTRIHTLVGETD